MTAFTISTAKTEKATDIQNNKTVTELVNQQTEAIKKIISAQKLQHVEYPIVTRQDATVKDTVKENPKDSNEDLHVRCQQLLNQQWQKSTTPPTKNEKLEIITNINEASTEKPYGLLVRPELLKSKLPNTNNQFGLTENENNIQLIKFEPVILQKTILKDGKVLYYWHKSLPFPQYLMVPKLDYPNPSSATNPPYKSQISHPTSTTSTTTTTVKPISTTKEPLYSEELRFVVPMPYASDGSPPKFPSQFDPYAYYPKYMQPHTMNLEIPYQPTFPVLKTLVIPNKFIQNDQ